MSYRIGFDAIHLRPGPRLAHTEYCSNDRLMSAVREETGQAFEDAWDIDFLWSVDDGPVPWAERGRCTDMGHAEFLEGGVDRRAAQSSPFTDPEQVLTFDAVEEYGLTDFDELVAHYEEHYQKHQQAHPNQVFTAGYYKTIVSGAIEAFGWEMLLLGAVDLARFEKVLDSIYRLSLHHYKAWAQTSAPVFISHDDMVWSEGPFLDPAFYRAVIFPRYKELWKVLKDAGKKVLYCSDGDFTLFIDDVVEAGADGLIFEPMTSLERVVEHYGNTHCIVSSKVDCRTLTFGTRDQIRTEIDATLEVAFDCPGFMFAVGNHIPSNVPFENARFYIDYLRQNWAR
ncbi:MAG: uroporphyrinogen decarboxylase family protein [Candidatus Hydrogenedentota bacterium]